MYTYYSIARIDNAPHYTLIQTQATTPIEALNNFNNTYPGKITSSEKYEITTDFNRAQVWCESANKNLLIITNNF